MRFTNFIGPAKQIPAGIAAERQVVLDEDVSLGAWCSRRRHAPLLATCCLGTMRFLQSRGFIHPRHQIGGGIAAEAQIVLADEPPR